MKRLFFAVLVLSFPLFLHAEETDKETIAAGAYPGVADLLPRASRLSEEAAKAEARIATLGTVAPVRDKFQLALEYQAELDERVSTLGEVEGWTFNRLLDIRTGYSLQKDLLSEILDEVSNRISEIDAIRQTWTTEREFLKGWESTLREPGVQIPPDVFPNMNANAERILKSAADAANLLVSIQNEVLGIQELNLNFLSRIDASLATLRKELFKKTAFSFADRDYYRQFGDPMWNDVRAGLSQVKLPGYEFVRNQGWIFILQSLIASMLWGFIRRHRSQEVTEQWHFIIDHPMATGIFVSITSLSFLYNIPPESWRLFLWVLAAFSAAILVAGLLKNRLKISAVFILASLFVISFALKIISFPTPLYRLYLGLLSLVGIPLLLAMARKNVREHEGKTDGFTMALRVGAIILSAAFISQFGGYSTLASRLIESSVETVFLGLFAAMAVRIGRGGIEYFIESEFLGRYRFFRRSGEELCHRLEWLYKVSIWGYAAIYVLTVWGVYDTSGQAWDGLMNIGFVAEDEEYTLRMLFNAFVTLYGAILISWLLRSVLDNEIFYRSQIDRGVRDSIKKLLHYALVLIGFLIALAFAGFEMKHFVVVAGAFGIGIGFGLQNIVNNFVSGLILLFERPVKAGDVIVLDGEWGTIKKIGLRSTVVETLDQAEIIVPNSDLISEKVTNWTLSSSVTRLVLPVGVAYGSDVALVLEILSEAADTHPDILKDPPPSPIFTGFGNSSLDFELRAWLGDVSKRLKVKSELGQSIDSRFRERGVEIPFPQRDLHIRSIKCTLPRDL